MVNLVLFIIASFGLTNIFAFGKIFDKIRPHYYYFTCPMCIGFPVGFLIYLFFLLSGIKLFNNIYIGAFIFSCISSGTSYILCNIFDDNGFNVKYN